MQDDVERTLIPLVHGSSFAREASSDSGVNFHFAQDEESGGGGGGAPAHDVSSGDDGKTTFVTFNDPRFSEWAKMSTCCVLAFLYPVPTPKRTLEVGPEGMVVIVWTFEVLAVYKNGGVSDDGFYCSCACCEFRQYRTRHTKTQVGTWNSATQDVTPGNVPDTEDRPYGEDCEGGVCYGDNQPALRPGQSAGRSYEIDESNPIPAARDDRANELLRDALAKLKESDPTLTEDGVCIYYMKDVVTMGVRPPALAEGTWCFTGEIWDKCHQSLKRRKSFKLDSRDMIYLVSGRPVASTHGSRNLRGPTSTAVDKC